MLKPFTSRAVVAGLALFGLGALALRAADTGQAPGPAAAASATPAAGPSAGAGGRYFEMRTYHAAPGKLDALHARFRDHTISLFKKHGIESVAYWTVAPRRGSGAAIRRPRRGREAPEGHARVHHRLPHRRRPRQAVDRVRARTPAWAKAKTESEKDGPLVEKVEQVFMTPTDYSPLR
jgi:hypothetical protein